MHLPTQLLKTHQLRNDPENFLSAKVLAVIGWFPLGHTASSHADALPLAQHTTRRSCPQGSKDNREEEHKESKSTNSSDASSPLHLKKELKELCRLAWSKCDIMQMSFTAVKASTKTVLPSAHLLDLRGYHSIAKAGLWSFRLRVAVPIASSTG